MTKPNDSKTYVADSVPTWRYVALGFEPPKGKKLSILTQGGMSVIGKWQDRAGYVAWAPLLKKDSLQSTMSDVLSEFTDNRKPIQDLFKGILQYRPSINRNALLLLASLVCVHGDDMFYEVVSACDWEDMVRVELTAMNTEHAAASLLISFTPDLVGITIIRLNLDKLPDAAFFMPLDFHLDNVRCLALSLTAIMCADTLPESPEFIIENGALLCERNPVELRLRKDKLSVKGKKK